MSFEEWVAAFEKHVADMGVSFGPNGNQTAMQHIGEALLRDWYDDHYTPAEAWAEIDQAND